MAAIHELLKQVSDPALRARLTEEVERLTQNKKFGLVFEDHLAECTPLYGVAVKRGGTAAKKAGKIGDTYTVLQINGEKALCRSKSTGDTEEIALNELVTVAEIGDAIFPCLQPIDKVENAPDSDLWHTLIEADNYHALQLLEYLYAGKVDCIYIDPPYNTGARDWKYNNDYVDGSDSYRHSKWLSMMKKRLSIAKRLLNPADSVMIVTIDEKEYLHLGCLLEEMFPEAIIQMISSVINPKGVSSQQGFKRADEYIFFVMLGTASPEALPLGLEWSPSANKANNSKKIPISTSTKIGWTSMMRRGSHSARKERPGLYYAIFANPKTHKIEKIGEPLPDGIHSDLEVEGLVQILPIRSNGSEGCWQVGSAELRNRIIQGRVRLGKEASYGYVVNYLPDGEYDKILSGFFSVVGKAEDGSLITRCIEENDNKWIAPTQWKIASHDASQFGSTMLSSILCTKRFAFPKSLYAERDTLRFFVANKPNALIVDFFAGSGTTLHAVNLLNAEDGGNRRCILVTNNEVSEAEAKQLTAQGLHPGDEDWEKYGIARYVTWPRTVCSIEGHDINGDPLKGNYIGSDIPMSDGFAANCEYFKLGFLDRDLVTLGQQFREILPLLWMKSGAVGCRPVYESEEEPVMLILPENRFAVLVDESAYASFAREIQRYDCIDTVYFVTNSEPAYREMSSQIGIGETYQLYRDYIDNFVIGARRARV